MAVAAVARKKAEKESTGLTVTAEELALKQREISVSEFFVKNRHLLGFDNPSRALLTAVKEAVDNSLDACEEAGVPPDIEVKIKMLSEDRFTISIEDNGPGIVRAQIPNIFGKLLYGSKFHTLKMSRGQQGIGISAAGLYGQLTTGKPIVVTSKTAPQKPAHYYEIVIDTNKNQPIIAKEEEIAWEKKHGTKVEIELEARYVKGGKSVDDYIRQTVIANPHVRIHYEPPSGENITYERSSKTLPTQPKAIKPHPYGVELGNLMKILHSSKSRQLKACLQGEFSRVSPRIAKEICAKAGVPDNSSPRRIAQQEAENLYKAINATKIMAPPTDCLSPIGEAHILVGLKNMVKADFYTSVTRSPAIYRGNPFQIEIGMAYGVEGYAAEDLITLNRYANRVPLLYQPGACAITKAVIGTDWRNYGLSQSKSSLPVAPMLLMVHMASVWVPFTSEAKEAIAHYNEIVKEIKLALQECGRRMNSFVRKREKAEYELKRRSLFEMYIEELSIALNDITACGKEKVKKHLLAIAREKTKSGEI
ncbi:MAG: DNA topoisomerase VI subunit B [Planctomycetes bacterium RBG_16_59_8]|nr:MAG: DNA topoisomerase VI subunit B [Planctomycetes bacterium RBG_16_59_8]